MTGEYSGFAFSLSFAEYFYCKLSLSSYILNLSSEGKIRSQYSVYLLLPQGCLFEKPHVRNDNANIPVFQTIKSGHAKIKFCMSQLWFSLIYST